MNVAQDFKKMVVFLNKNAFISAPKQLSVCLFGSVEALGVHTANMPHCP
jgi:hypothetical protein